MIKITLQVDGMQCGMCEAHVNDAIRRAFPVKKVTSSHSKGQTVIPVSYTHLKDTLIPLGWTSSQNGKRAWPKLSGLGHAL